MLLSQELLKAITGRTEVPRPLSKGENRAEPRCLAGASGHIVPLRGGSAGAPSPVQIQNMSIKGVGLVASTAMRVSEQFILRLTPEVGSPVWIQCVTRRWQPLAADRFLIGAEYVRVVTVPASGNRPGARQTGSSELENISQTLQQAVLS